MPTVTFVKISGIAVKVRVYVNRTHLLLSSTVAVSEKLLVNLKAINSLRLSNTDLNRLIADVEVQLREFLLQEPLAVLFPKRAASAARVLGVRWKCEAKVSLLFLAHLRSQLGVLLSDDAALLEQRNVTLKHKGRGALMSTLVSFAFDEEEKQVEYKLAREQTLDAPDALALFVLERPKHA